MLVISLSSANATVFKSLSDICLELAINYKVNKFSSADIPAGILVIEFAVSVRIRIEGMLYKRVDNSPDRDLPVQFLNKHYEHTRRLLGARYK